MRVLCFRRGVSRPEKRRRKKKTIYKLMHVYVLIVGLPISPSLGKEWILVRLKFIYQTPEEFAHQKFHLRASKGYVQNGSNTAMNVCTKYQQLACQTNLM